MVAVAVPVADTLLEARATLSGALVDAGFRVAGDLDPITPPCVLVRFAPGCEVLGNRAACRLEAVAIPGAQFSTGAGDIYAGQVLAVCHQLTTATAQGFAPDRVVSDSGAELWGIAIALTVNLTIT